MSHEIVPYGKGKAVSREFASLKSEKHHDTGGQEHR